MRFLHIAPVSLLLGSLAITGAGCAGDLDSSEGPDEAAAAASEPLFLAPTRAFTQNDNTVPMCWATPGYAAEKKLIAESIGRAWVAEADLRVTWADACPTAGRDLVVQVQIGTHDQVRDANGSMYWDHDSLGQTRGFGMETLSAPASGPLDPTGTPGTTFWVEPNGGSLDRPSRLAFVAVHEFGHVLGFRDEQSRPEPEARACNPETAPGTTIGPYDPDSVMNNCGHHRNESPVLSAGDRSGVRQVYGPRKPWRQWGSPGDRPLHSDFDGDGRTDVAVFRPASGTWLIVDSSTHLERTVQWGWPGDIAVPADYDGDGKADLAVWRPSTGIFWVLRSSDGYNFGQNWGQPGDTPVPGDYDGDGKADLAVWRPSAGLWLIIRSSDHTLFSKAVGASTDIPVPGDYDGDGRADLAVWRPSTGVWWILRSSDGGFYGTPWGTPLDRPVPRDYDGDGRVDLAVFRPAESRFYITNSRDGSSFAVGWGRFGDYPVTGDYDGDGAADIAVWRPSTATWSTMDAPL